MEHGSRVEHVPCLDLSRRSRPAPAVWTAISTCDPGDVRLLCWGASGAESGAIEVDAEIVLAVDISYSMDAEEQQLQRSGYIEALTSPEFFSALQSGLKGSIALTYVEWAGAADQQVVVGWRLIDGPIAARKFADELASANFRRAYRTSIAGSIDFSAHLFTAGGFASPRRIIDISGDGPNNDGRWVTAARDDAVAHGITINQCISCQRPSHTRPAWWATIEHKDVEGSKKVRSSNAIGEVI